MIYICSENRLQFRINIYSWINVIKLCLNPLKYEPWTSIHLHHCVTRKRLYGKIFKGNHRIFFAKLTCFGLKMSGYSKKWSSVVGRSGKYDDCGKVSYPKSVRFCSFMLARCGRALSWSWITSSRLTSRCCVLLKWMGISSTWSLAFTVIMWNPIYLVSSP